MKKIKSFVGASAIGLAVLFGGVAATAPPIDFDKIVSRGYGVNEIPSIDNPKFESPAEADAWLSDSDLVMTLVDKETERVYPLEILVWHEIVNDSINGKPVLVTYCPLTDSGRVYFREVDYTTFKFLNSGSLLNSNTLMYSNDSTMWTQIDGRAIFGNSFGVELIPLKVDVVKWGEWNAEHPDSQVLSRDTGFERDYGSDPYGGYANYPDLRFPAEPLSDLLPTKEVVYGLQVEGQSKAYKEADITTLGTIEDRIGEVDILIERQKDGTVNTIRKDTGEALDRTRGYWFAWYAFHPDTLVYSTGQ